LRDRFLTPQVARAITSPSGIVLGGAGASVAILIGLPIAAILGAGAIAWAARVAVAVPRNDSSGRSIDPFALQEPWRGFVRGAQQARRKFDEAVHNAHPGPMRDRLAEIGDRLDDAVNECWRVARQGQSLSDARSQLDTTAAQQELGTLDPSSTAHSETADALRAQIASAQRVESTITDTRDRLRLLDARMDEAVARAVELSVAGADDDLGGLGSDVDILVGDMEALRQGLEESDHAGDASPGAA
jgi:hypothetical protein